MGIKSLFNSAYDPYKRLDEDRKVEVRFGVKIAS
jgi:cation transport regulator ChaB